MPLVQAWKEAFTGSKESVPAWQANPKRIYTQPVVLGYVRNWNTPRYYEGGMIIPMFSIYPGNTRR